MQLYTKILIGMVLGIVLGFFLGPNSFLLPATGVQLTPEAEIVDAPGSKTRIVLAEGITKAKILTEPSDESGWVQIEWSLKARNLLQLQKEGKIGTDRFKTGDRVTGWVLEKLPEVRRFSPLGATLVDSVEWIGRLFLALIKMVVVPLVFCSLIVGVASLGDFRKLGRLGGRTLVFFLITTVVALLIGVGLANLIQPGKMMSEQDRAILLSSYRGEATEKVADAAASPSTVDQILSIVPENPLEALAKGDMLQIIFFAAMLGIALTLMPGRRSQLVVDLMDRLNDAMVMLVHVIMKMAPYGVAALLFKVIGSTGISVLLALAVYGLVVMAGLAIHIGVTYALFIRFGARLPLFSFLKAVRPAQLLAFSTSSSSATLPVTKECCEQNIRVSKEVSSFVLPLGATVNMDGTALYQGVAALFIAQIYNMDLGFAEQVTIVVSATLASVGAAGVPGAGMVTLAMVLTQVGVPTEGLALILGLDRLLDMFRSATNVTGDCTATTVMARLEGESLHLLTPEEDASDPKHGFEHRLTKGPHSVRPEPEDSNE
jgi:proton glutamate symport protein